MDRDTFISTLLNKGVSFNSNQLKLIETVDKPVVGIACAGSGKTTSILGSILYLTEVKGVDPTRILVITFSKSAVEDVKVRFKKLSTSLGITRNIEFRTFHSLFYYLLRLYVKQKLDILDEGKKYSMIAGYLRQLGITYNEETIEKIISLMSYKINNCLTDEEFLKSPKFLFEGINKELYTKVAEMYTRDKLLIEKVDFDDLQYLLYNLLKNRQDVREHARKLWDYFIIDEFQDISKIQMYIMHLMIDPSNHKNVKVVGDDDQAIYGWRGSDNRFILGFDRIFKGAEKIYIDTNYRCPATILDFAKDCIENNKVRFKKQINAYNTGGNIKITIGSSLKDASMQDVEHILNLIHKGVKPQDIAVLYRDHTSLLFVVDYLLRLNIPINLKSVKGLMYDNRIVLDILDVLDFIENPNNKENFIKGLSKVIPYYNKFQAEKDSKRLGAIPWDSAISARSYTQMHTIEKLQDTIMLVGTNDASRIFDKLISVMSNRMQFWSDYLYYTVEEISDIFEYLRDLAENRTLSQFRREFEAARERINMMVSTGEPGVNFMTMHSAKGLEFNSVFVINVSKDRFPNAGILDKMSKIYGDEELSKIIEEERRLFYVAMTRAKENLFLSYVNKPSIFLDEIFAKQKQKGNYYIK